MTAMPIQAATEPDDAPAREPDRRSVVQARSLSLTFETADGPVFALSDIDLDIEHWAVRLRQDDTVTRDCRFGAH